MPGGNSVFSTFEPESQPSHRKNNSNKFRRFVKVFSSCKILVYHFIQISFHSLTIFFVFFTEHIGLLLRLVPKRIYPKLPYPIIEEIVSTTTRVIFTRSKQNSQPVCLKLWPVENTSYHVFVTKNINYLLEGFEFNKRFAPFVYLGIAPVYIKQEFEQPKYILRGKLLEKPKEQDIKGGVNYVIVMRGLNVFSLMMTLPALLLSILPTNGRVMEKC